MRTLHALPLTRAAYAPFGDVLAAAPDELPARSANQGRAQVWDRIGALENLRPGARPNLGVFRIAPWPEASVAVTLLERHPASTQAFLPLAARRYLVVVAPPGPRPDPAAVRAFLARPDQGITYHPGIWHHPFIGLDAEADFACLVWEDGTAGDCELVSLPEADRVRVTW